MARRVALDYMEQQSAAGADYAWRLFVIAYLTPIVGAVAQLPGREDVSWWYVLAAVLAWSLGILLGVAEERRASHSDHTGITTPAVTLLIGMSIIVSIFSVEMALSPHDATMRWLLLVPVMVIATMGNRVMLAVTALFAAATLAVASAQTQPGGTTSWPADLLIAAVIVFVMRVFAERVIRSFARDTLFGSMSEVAATADSLADGWARVLPMVASYLDAGTVIVIEHDGRDWVPRAAWPSGATLDLDDATLRQMVELAADSEAPVLEGDRTAIGGVVDDRTIVAVATGTATRVVDGMYQLYRSHQVALQLRLLVGRVRSIEALAEQGRTDSLTGLPNRRTLTVGLSQAMADATSAGHPLCAVMVDLDHFKDYNDEFGHLEGDHALAEVAALMTRRMRNGDLVCRYGGEEFAMVLPRAALADAVRILDELRPQVRDLELARPLTVSAGVAEWDGHEAPDALLERADRALYLAKAAGRDRVQAAPTERTPPAAAPTADERRTRTR